MADAVSSIFRPFSRILPGWAFFSILPAVLLAQQPSAEQNPVPVIKSSVHEVLIPVVVHDRHGDAVGDLKKEDFQVLDDGKPQTITGFTLLSRANTGAGPSLPAAGPANLPHDGAKPDPPQPRFMVLLFDNMNLSASDLMQAQKAATRVLETSLPAADMAAVVSTSGANSGFTQDHGLLRDTILKLRANTIYRHDSTDCPNVDYYQADRIINKNDDQALQVATEDALACSRLPREEEGVARQMAMSASQRAIAMGEQNARANLSFLRLVVSKMAALPGQRILILVSSGFLTANGDASALKSQVLDLAAQGDVIIHAIDARGLYTTSLDATTSGGANAMGTRLMTQYRQESMSASGDVMAELADGSGGTYFHNSNDLEAGLGNLLSGPRYMYLLSFSAANVKPNGSYHRLKVKVDHDGLSLQARRGYVAPKPEKASK